MKRPEIEIITTGDINGDDTIEVFLRQVNKLESYADHLEEENRKLKYEKEIMKDCANCRYVFFDYDHPHCENPKIKNDYKDCISFHDGEAHISYIHWELKELTNE